MKKMSLLFTAIFLLFIAAPGYAGLATFDDVSLASPSASNYTGPGGGRYYNGADGAGGFTSDGAFFINTYDSTYKSWDGWSVSNTTDTTTAGYTNQYSAYTGAAHDGTQYGVFYEPWTAGPTVSFTASSPVTVTGAYFTNTTYAALSMLNGDGFAKKFGGATGDDQDWFKLTIKGVDGTGAYTTHTVDFYLADYRNSDNSLDYIVDEWIWVDLSVLGPVIGLEFDLSSSDVGDWGMNTPAYFAMDSLNAVPVPAAVWLLGSGLIGLVAIRRRQA